MFIEMTLYSSIVIFCIGILYFFGMMICRKRLPQNRRMIPFAVLAVCTALSIFLVYFGGNKDAEGGPIDHFVVSLLGSFRVLSGENSVWDTRGLYEEIAPELSFIFSLYTALLHFTASSVVLGVVLKVVDKFFPKIRYSLYFHRTIYVFSGVSEREVLLAEDIYKHQPDAVLVFLNNTEEADNNAALLERIKEVSGYLFAYDVTDLPIPYFCRSNRIHYYLLQEDDGRNINDAMKLAERYPDHANNVYVHVLSDNVETERILDSVSGNDNCNFRLLSETKIMLYQLMEEMPLFLGARERAGHKELTILIVGAGRVGREAVKICSWCGYTSQLSPVIYVIDRDRKGYEQLLNECPETMKGAIYFEQIDVESSQYKEFLRKHKEIGYVICGLGEEHLNLRTAMETRSVFFETGSMNRSEKELPIINVLLNDSVLNRMAGKLEYEKPKKNQPERENRCVLTPFGSLENFYSWDNMVASRLEGGAYSVHRFYMMLQNPRPSEKEIFESYENSEYGRSSSMATALHAIYKAYAYLYEMQGMDMELFKKITSCGDGILNKRDSYKEICKLLARKMYAIEDEEGNYISAEKRKEKITALAIMEHTRWNAYMRATGWRGVSASQAKAWGGGKNMAAKLHPNIVPWEELDPGTRKYDEIMIWGLPFILNDGNRYESMILPDRKKKGKKADCGFYQTEDFEAVLYWQNYPLTDDEKKVVIAGDAAKVTAYLRHALLLNIYASDRTVEYLIYCKENIAEAFAVIDEQIKDSLTFVQDSQVPEALLSEEGTRVVNIDTLEINRNCVADLRADLLRKAQAMNANYAGKNGGKQWEDLEAHKKSSSICAASIIERHREHFKQGVPVVELSEIEHERWCRFHYVHGWRYGEVRDDSRKIHNCLIPYDALSPAEKQKDIDNLLEGMQLLEE